MKLSKIALALAAALALVACGKKDEAGAGPAAKTSAASPLDSAFRFEDGAPLDIDALFALMSDDRRPTYDSAEFDQSLGATVVTNLRFSDDDDGEGVLVERAEFYGVDLDALERVKAAQDAGPDAPFEKAFEKVRLLNVSAEGFEDEDSTLSIGGIEFDRLDLRQGAGHGDSDSGAHFFNSVKLAGVYFKDIALETSGEEAPAIVMSAPDLRFVGLGGGKLAAIIANDLEYALSQSDASRVAMSDAFGPQGAMLMNGPLRTILAPNNQRTTMESFEWRGIDMSGLMEWGLKDEEPPATERDLIDLGTIRAAGVDAYIEDRHAATVEEMTVSAAEFTWLIPSNVRIDTKGAVTDFTAYVPETETAVIDILKQYGLDETPNDSYAEWIWNPDRGKADLDYVANAKKLMNLSMAFGLEGLKLDDIAAAQTENNAESIAAAVAFRNLSLKIEDEQALDVLFALSALQMGGTAEDLRQSAPAMIRLSGAQAAQMNPRIADYVDAVADFVAEGGTLEISADPEEPVLMMTLQQTMQTAPQSLPDVINLTVTRSK